MSTTARKSRAVLAACVLAMTVGCTTLYRNHGYAPSDAQLSEVLIGVDTRATVADTLGPPTAGGVATGSDYYYVQSRFQLYGPLEPREIDREVVAIRFDSAGVVENVERFGLENGNVVPLSRRVTERNVRDTTFLRQLFGSIGRFDAGDFLGDS
ncbi:outer membrane protein assembly factor BamE [Thalassorhabdomicrobium marinisediminis]|uniref:Lipo-like protein n=1 Tax=Thalassorhabdomicrobium marinisediminis TaxID=2170577 RepID=A0A2T7G112_9RHOB|nr:outer membrane protein assembly factor BamE [Thalassorhabdomicrobium marinisediminis]PVA08114.1 lipo-like protein [Thalassorhabdomicrobium marinisediminis]